MTKTLTCHFFDAAKMLTFALLDFTEVRCLRRCMAIASNELDIVIPTVIIFIEFHSHDRGKISNIKAILPLPDQIVCSRVHTMCNIYTLVILEKYWQFLDCFKGETDAVLA